MKKNLFQSDFKVPELLETNKFRIRMLQAKDARLDYEAVMSSTDHLRKNPNPAICNGWPTPDLTLEKDIKDLEWHESKHKSREIFTFTVMNKDESKCLGCVYIFPSSYKEFDAEVYFWVTKEEFEKGSDKELYNILVKWFKEEWLFKKIIFPNRNINPSY